MHKKNLEGKQTKTRTNETVRFAREFPNNLSQEVGKLKLQFCWFVAQRCLFTLLLPQAGRKQYAETIRVGLVPQKKSHMQKKESGCQDQEEQIGRSDFLVVSIGVSDG